MNVDQIAVAWSLIGLATAALLQFITAPFGRHYSNSNWGPSMPDRVGWIVFESVSPLALWLSFFVYGEIRAKHNLLLIAMWSIHYIHRAWIYPFRTHTNSKRMPWLVCACAMFFNTVNGFINGFYIGNNQFNSFGLIETIGLVRKRFDCLHSQQTVRSCLLLAHWSTLIVTIT